MAFPVAPGKVDIGPSPMRYIPQLWANKLLVKYYDATVLAAITNTDYEGMIKKMGDTVYIRTRPTLTIRDYTKGQTLVNEQPESEAQTLLIDKGKYWSFVADDVDKVQTDIKSFINEWTTDAAEQLKINVDTDVLGSVPTDAHASNRGASAGVKSSSFALGVHGSSPVTVTKVDILDKLVDCGTVLDEQNVPETGRFFIIPPWMAGMIKKSDLKDASLTGDSKSPIRNGLLGMIDRFTLYSSNLLAGSSSDQACLFGHKDATTFATQLVKSKAQDNPNGFGTLHRGLMVYGYEVVKPEALGVLAAAKG